MEVVWDVLCVVVYFWFYSFILHCYIFSKELFCVNINDSLELHLPNCIPFAGILIVTVLID